jgi:hypothetical protein
MLLVTATSIGTPLMMRAVDFFIDARERARNFHYAHNMVNTGAPLGSHLIHD